MELLWVPAATDTCPYQVHSRLGEVFYIKGITNGNDISALVEALRRFCRSLELCEGFTRGYYGLKLVCD